MGLTGAGKTTYSQQVLEPQGAVRLSVDEEVFERHGRYGIDYPEDGYFEREAPVIAELHQQLAELVIEGRDVVWDHGLWQRQQREAVKELVKAASGCWRLLYFPLGREELLRRLAERNEREDANALMVTPHALDDFIARFEEPQGEGEEVVEWYWC
ncbi:ATP-binding protein [Streptomyces virginiae]